MIVEPLVSIIIPNYNNSFYLKSCIDSIQNQSYKNIEIIIVDDCSTDNSIEVLKEIQKKYKNVYLYKNKINMGVSYTRNLGVKKSNGTFISTLDPDDEYYEDKIYSEVTKILSIPDVNAIIYSGFNSVDENLKPIRLKTKINKFNAAEGDLYNRLCYMVIPVPRDMLMRKQHFISVGGFNESMSLYEDWDLKLRLAKKYNFYYSGSKGVKYRRHSSGLSSLSFNKHFEVMIKVFYKYTKNPNVKLFKIINNKNKMSKFIKLICYLPFVNFFFK
ncbi:glycosyltransferase family 2 protein [Pectobacterium brasiliense]|uniref:glycosyltransferase family 2 protein n=1 Tax=Pectobacterium brasiliense TaxID=180957 RepID=UPI0015DF2D17|nr:glycosyltransferase family A protein [Pectobacterium brasiliense]MBA0217466.1 glycosyltransferase family 2 protein [Pectobacterium brasiliense]MBN3071769.1 glycosyltransferase family 2 protein [Pectobacterium brasiliense]MBN3168626.1 glycosyltransferase family 2 protein [Pectobacterium brasiliense]